ncbi:YebC/PmpR family DNA-binding transcriptional regulator [Hydrogenovibrio kuenenii]|uniref:YebC/PmpR family DNA-binding transcriptional regulator n=1 Tax=Hydrogenovibrio kuenenii TaxID=63658 RepID=UPI000467DE1B|nr:YebC/PmpR family DNA-binding transcriptional regulator [Hydrogenovibrio kuenenii]
MGRAYQNRKDSMAKTSNMKAKVYSKFSKEIYVCAKNSGADPSANLALSHLIEKAKQNQVPAHVIDKALEKASGAGGEDFITVRFEGFGPGGCMMIVDCLTDNNNRTFGEVRGVFNKIKAKLGTPGTTAHMFDHRAVFEFKYDDEDAVLEALMEADIDVSDVESEGEIVRVLTPPTEYFKARTALMEAFPDVTFETDEITFIPQTYTLLQGEDLETFDKFLDLLNDLDDVQEIYHNVEVED